MVAFKYTSILALVAGINAQGIFGAPENSGDVLAQLKKVDDSTISSGVSAGEYDASPGTTADLIYENEVLLGDWTGVGNVADLGLGFYSDEGAQAIIDYVNNIVFPDTVAADDIYVENRPKFVAGGFNNFINPGLISLRRAVSVSSSAVQAKTRANKLTAMTEAFLKVQQNYADTQQIQQFGSLQS